jgi:hypothetical protein
MACPILTVDADFTQYNNPSEFSSSSAMDVAVLLSFDQASYTNLDVQITIEGQVFSSNNTSISTPILPGISVFENVNLQVSITTVNGSVCVYNEDFTADQEVGEDIPLEEVYYRTFFTAGGVEQIEGCTDPNASNYNPNANISIDTCVYPDDDDGGGGGIVDPPDIEQPTLITYTEGCNNPLAVNYNPIAQINDGSCVFISGCTLPFADNYNDRAVVDDGSCVCNSYNILLDFSGSTNGYYIPLNSGFCTTVLSFDYTLELTCEDIFDIYLENTGSTLTDILDSFSLDFKVYNTDYEEIYTKSIWKHDFNDDEIDLYINQDEFCDLFYEKLRQENSISCDIPIENKYKIFRSKQEFIIPNLEGQNVLFTFQLKNISTPHCIFLDNIRLVQFCEQQTSECILIPKTFGFELEKQEDNVKTSLSPDQLLLNSKEITLRISPIDYINQDIVDYYNKNSYYLREDKLYVLSLNEINKQLIDVRNRQTVSTYIYHDYIYDNYINSMYSCSLTSKELDYGYADEVYKRIDTIWYDLIEQFIPATSIKKGGHYYYKNLDVHQQKYEHRGYTLDKGCEGNAVADFEIITDDPCVKVLTYKSRFEQVLEINGLCDQCLSTGVTYSYFDAGNNESGRLIQYSGDNVNNIIETINFDTTTELIDCTGCTATVVITNVEINGGTLFVYFTTTNVNSSDVIFGVYGRLQMTLDNFDENNQTGVFILDKANGAGQVAVSVQSEECGDALDLVDFQRCEIVLPQTSFILDPFNPTYDVTYQFNVYGTTDINDINVTVNGVPGTNITYLGTTTFSVDYTRSLSGDDEVVVTAQMDCGTVTETVINNET